MKINENEHLCAIEILKEPSQRKHLKRWIFSLRKNYLLEKKEPWISFDAIDYLSSIDLTDKKVFEYGSGGSTLYWLKRGGTCVSIENDPKWYSVLKPKLLNHADRIDYRFVQPEYNGYLGDISNPDDYVSSSPYYQGYTFKKYVAQIDEFKPDSFDMVLVDGRARPACIKHALGKVKIGGFLILDDLGRSYYTEKTKPLLSNFDCQLCHGVTPCSAFTHTTGFYRRIR